MAGTKIGGMRAAATNKAKHGKGFYARIGQMGGKNGHTGGFAYANPVCECDLFEERHKKARCAGVRGGRISRRRPSTVTKQG